MRLVINVVDNMVGIDGEFLAVDTTSLLLKNIRAVHWNGLTKKGHYEHTNGKNILLTSCDMFLDIVEKYKLAQKKIIEAEAARKLAITTYENIKKNIDSILPICDPVVVNLVIEKKFTGLKLSAYNVESQCVGVYVDNLERDSSGNGVKGLLSVKKLFALCRDLQINVIAELKPTIISRDRFADFLISLGAVVIRNEECDYMFIRAE